MQVAGQKAQLFARLDRRARQDDAGDLLVPEGRDRSGNGKVSLARARRADAHDDRIFADGLHIAFLAERLGLDRLALGRDAENVAAHGMHLGLAAVARQADDVLHGLRADRLAAPRHCGQRADRARGDLHIIVPAGDLEFGPAADDRHAELALDQFDIFVKCTENRHEQLGLFHLDCLFYGLHLAFVFYGLDACRSAPAR